jgi:cell shape-determining protein MreD
MLKDQSILSNGHVFFAGIINDVVSGLPLGVSALSYLTVSFVAMYVKNVTVNITLFTDWFTFIIAVFFSNLIFLILIYNFTELSVTYTEIFYNSFFTLLFYPLFWLIFNIYRSITGMKTYD